MRKATARPTRAANRGLQLRRRKDCAERLIHLPVERLSPGRKTPMPEGDESDAGVPSRRRLRCSVKLATKVAVAENLSDDVVLIDAATGTVEKRFDLSENDAVPSTYPIAVATTATASARLSRFWNASEIVELDLAHGTVARKLALLKPPSPIAAGHASLRVCLFAGGKNSLRCTRQSRRGCCGECWRRTIRPSRATLTRACQARVISARSLLLSPLMPTASRLYVANMATDAVAVIDPRKLTPKAAKTGMIEPDGFIPTEWMPMSMAFVTSASSGKLGGKTVHRDRQREGNRAEQFSAKNRRIAAQSARGRPHVYRLAALTVRWPRLTNRRSRATSPAGLRPCSSRIA